jgi:hypothetical protein
MRKPNPIFEQNYEEYVRQVIGLDFLILEPIMKIRVNGENRTAEMPFFNTIYRVSPFGVVDEHGIRPDYGICVILLKHLLMCPKWVPAERDWVTNRDFSDSGQGQDTGLSEYAVTAIAKRYAGHLERLKAAASALEGIPRKPNTHMTFQLCSGRFPGCRFCFYSTTPTSIFRPMLPFFMNSARTISWMRNAGSWSIGACLNI